MQLTLHCPWIPLCLCSLSLSPINSKAISLSQRTTNPLAMRKSYGAENTPKAVLFLTVILTILTLYYSSYLGQWISSSPSLSLNLSQEDGPITEKVIVVIDKCDIFKGEWVPNSRAPYYTNETCWAIHDHQNCMKFGRSDIDYMKWRWRPYDCELSIFNPEQFLELVRDKSMAFVGDSVGRNQMQSLMCLLSRVATPVDVSPTTDHNFKQWHYPSHNFTLANLWSTFLVTADETEPMARDPVISLYNLYLDEPDVNWTTQVHRFDYTIFSVSHWFFRPTMYYLNRKLIGCYLCNRPNVTSFPLYYGYRLAFRSAFAALNAMESYNGITILRTYSPDHYEGGGWDKGGDCLRTKPFLGHEKRLEGFQMEMYMTQVEEYRKAAEEGGRMGRRFGLLDTTEVMLMRPDGHPGRYGHPAAEKVAISDCVHWCLPGPVDTWNDFLLYMMKMEGRRRVSLKEG